MAKVHSSLATTELHNPKGIGVESATLEVLTISASLGAVSASASIVPHTTDAFNLGSDTQRWNNITAAGNISSSTTSTGSFGRLELAGNADIDGTLTIAGGTTTLGDSDSDTVVISADLASNLIPDADNTRDIGSVAASWRNIHLDGTGSFKNTIISNKEYFSDAGGEHISGDGTDLTIASGRDINLTATTDINIPADVGLTFGNDAEKIEGDGTDLTIAGNNINLTAVADVKVPANVGIMLGTHEKIESDDTDLTITVGSGGDINVGADIGMTFGNDGEKIEGDGTDLTIASSGKLNLTATSDVHVPKNVGIVFDDNASEKIESNDTDLTINSGADINLTATSDVNIPANVGVTFGDDGEKIEGDGTNMTISANKILINSAETSGSSTSTGSFAHGHFASKVGINEVAPAEALEVVGNVSGSGTGSFHHGLVRQYSYLFDEGGEYLLGDGTDLTIASGRDINLTATTDINVPADVGMTFGNDGEKIEGDGTDLTIASSAKLNLTATSDVHIPQNVGLVFDANASEKIESNDTDLTINSGADINLTATSDVNIPANVGVTFGDDGEKIEGDGTDLTISANKIKINSALVSGSSTSTGSFANVFVANRLSFNDHSGNATGEYLESDGTDLNINVGGSGDINIPANIGMTFGNDGEKIEGDGTDLTINSSADINLTATSDINIPAEVGLTFGADTEKIEVDGSNNLSIISNGNTLVETVTFNNGNVTIPGDLTVTGNRLEAQVGSLQVADHTITVGSGSATSALMHNGGIDWGISGSVAFLRYRHAGTALSSSVFMEAPKLTVDTITLDAAEIDASGALTIDTGADLTLDATGDVNIPADIGLTFGNDGEKIEGDGTDLTIASSAKLNLTATSDVHIPQNVGLVFDANASEKIESNDTDLTINSGADINLTATADVNIPANVGITFGDDGEKIEGDGTDLTISANILKIASGMTSGSSVSSGSFAHGHFHEVGINTKNPAEALHVIGNVSGSGTGSFHHTLTRQYSYLFDEGGEYLTGDGTDLTIASGRDINLTATTDINIPADVGLTFGNDAEKIEGDGTDLTITGNKINLSPTADVHIPKNKGIVFDDNASEKIESNDTDLTINSGADINLTATADVNIPANVGITFGDDGEKIEGDGTDLTISANILKLNSSLTSGSNSSTGSFGNVFVANRLSFNDHSGNSTGEFLESDGTDLNINVGGSGDINIPADIGLTFGNDGEKIEGDGTDLTIAGAKINLTAESDVHIPQNIGLVFDANGSEKIESDDTDLTIGSGAKINLNATSDVHIPNDVGIVFGGASEKIEGDGTDLTISANNLTVDAAADIILDAGGNDTVIKSGGTTIASFKNASSDFVIVTDVDDKDILLKGQDGTSEITALQLDMSAAGLANFNNDVVAFYSSDERLKDNVVKIGDPLMKLSELRGVEFDWNKNKEAFEGEHSYGVIAQEVEKVLPEIVTERSDGYKAVKYELIVPLLIEAVKELNEKVERIEKNCDCLNK
jgi:hypothetical protein